MPSPTCPDIAYLVHDVDDASVLRRAEAFERGGASVEVIGFRRREKGPSSNARRSHVIGRSHDARLAQRAGLVLRQLLRPSPELGVARAAPAIVARNLEMLLIAARIRRPGQRLVYECLDLHRMLLSPSRTGSLLRRLERRLLQDVDLVITSSPAYEREYFRGRQHHGGPVELIENKVMSLPSHSATPSKRWQAVRRIGWFGMLRCRESFAMLREMVGRHPDLEVVIAGRPSPAVFDDLEADVSAVERMSFKGAYRPADLPKLYAGVDFAWCIDFYEVGLNSNWLLPNRLYESLAHGSVPVALASVETGRWLLDRQIGVVVDDPASIGPRLATMGSLRLEQMRQRVLSLPTDAVAFDETAHRSLVARVLETG